MTSGNAGSTIVLQSDVTTKAAQKVSQAVTIDGNGHKITLSKDATAGTDSKYSLFEIQTGATGNVTIKDVTLQSSKDAALLIRGGNGSGDLTSKIDLTLTDVTVIHQRGTGDNNTASSGRVAVQLATTGSVAITGSTFTETTDISGITTGVKAEAVQVYSSAKVVFTNNTVTGFNRALNIQNVTDATVTGNTISLVGSGTEKSKGVNMQDIGTSAKPGSIVITGNTVTSTNSKTTYEVSINDNDDAPTTDYFQSFITDADVTVLSGTNSATVDIAENGSLELRSGAILNVAGGTIDLANGSSMTVASGASVKVASGAKVTVDTAGTGKSAGTITNNGTISSVDAVATAFTNVPKTVTDKVVSAYSLKNATSGLDNVSILAGPSLVYAGETISVSAEPKDGYAIAKVFITYGVASTSTSTGSGSGTSSTTTVTINAEFDKSTGLYVLTLPSTIAASTEFTLNATVSGALTVTYVPVDASGKVLPGTQYIQGLKPTGDDSKIESLAPTLESAGYVFSGVWYSDAAQTTAVTLSSLKFTTGSGNDTKIANVVVYGLMDPAYAVNIVAEHGSVTASPESNKKEGLVSLIVSADDGYKFSSIKAVDAAGNEVKVTEVTPGEEYSITMPASAVTVTATFKQLHTVTVAADSTITASSPVWSIGDSTQSATKAATAQYVQGRNNVVITLTVPASANTALKTLAITGASGTAIKYTSAVDNDDRTKTNYTFSMPDEDVAVTYTYGDAYAVNFTASPSGAAVVVRDAGNTSIETGAKVAVGSTVTVTVTPSTENYVVSKLEATSPTTLELARGTPVEATSGTGNSAVTVYAVTYTFVMPSQEVTLGDPTTAQAYKVYATQTGSGNAKGPSNGYVSYEGEELDYSVLAASGSKLNSITVTLKSVDTKSESVTTATLFQYVYDVDAKTLTSYTYKYDNTGTTSATKYVITSAPVSNVASVIGVPTTGNVWSVIMQADNVEISFDFDDITYYNVALDDSTKDVKLYEKYENGEFSGEVDLTKKVAAGTYYIVVSQMPGQDVNNASATYTDKYSDYTKTTAVTGRTAGDKVTLTLISQDEKLGIYTVTLTGNTTIAAGYTDHYSVIKYSAENATMSLTDGTNTYKSGDSVKYDTVLTLVFTNVTSGYVVDEITATAGEVEFADSAYTYKVGMDDATIATKFAQGYTITLVDATGITLSAPAGAVEGRTIEVTYTAADGYELKGMTGVYGAASLTLDDLKASTTDENTWTFKMPAGNVTITATSEVTGDQPVKATAVYVSTSPSANGTMVILTGIGGYIPAGDITVTAFYKDSEGDTARLVFTIEVPEDTSATSFSKLITSSDANASAVYAGSATYTSDDGTFTASNAYSYLTVMTIAAAAAQE